MFTVPDRDLLQSTLLLGAMVEARDPYTGGHQWRVAQMAKLVGRHMGLSRAELFTLTLGGFIHDVGKVGVPDRILGKKGPLVDEEFEIVKQHPELGSDLIRMHPLGAELVDIVRHHHEQPDGNGYPDGLGGEEISVLASIVHVVDVFDALTSSRPYRSGMSWRQALSTIEAGVGNQYAVEPAAALRDLCEIGKLEHVLGHSSSTRTMVECLCCGPVIVVPESYEDGQEIECPTCPSRYRIQSSSNTAVEVALTGKNGSAKPFAPANSTGMQEVLTEIAAL